MRISLRYQPPNDDDFCNVTITIDGRVSGGVQIAPTQVPEFTRWMRRGAQKGDKFTTTGSFVPPASDPRQRNLFDEPVPD